jgi:Holliday junction resolvasome RuvABC endonuclease subunit
MRGKLFSIMAQRLHDARILAIALRSQRLGFVVTERSIELIHWGMIYYEGNEEASIAAAVKRVQVLFTRFTPSRVAIEKSHADKVPSPENLQSFYRCIRMEASRRSIPVSIFTRIKVRKAFADFGVMSKDEIAALLARMFPELQPKLPPRRKLWQREHCSMPLFDAVALAVACWRRDCFQE